MLEDWSLDTSAALSPDMLATPLDGRLPGGRLRDSGAQDDHEQGALRWTMADRDPATERDPSSERAGAQVSEGGASG